MKNKKEIVKVLLNQNIEDHEEAELLNMLVDEKLTIDVEKEANLSFGDKLADKISAIVGSWPFIICFCLLLIGWIILNGIMLLKPFDPFPFILLNLFLSCVAAIQAPIIMMSQNRQAKKDSLRNQNDYKTDLKSELILEDLHNKITICINNQNKIIKYIEEKEKK